MDPKQNGQLDPKLQEAYDRVMGISLTNDTPAAPQQNLGQATPASQPAPTMPLADVSVATSVAQPTSVPFDPAQLVSSGTASQPAATPQAPTQPAAETLQPELGTPQPLVQATPSTPTPAETSPQPTPVEVPAGAATIPAPEPIIIPHSEETVQVGGKSMDSLHQKTAVAHVGGKKGISPVLIVLGGVVFLLAYTLFWAKFFNAPLPFLNQ